MQYSSMQMTLLHYLLILTKRTPKWPDVKLNIAFTWHPSELLTLYDVKGQVKVPLILSSYV